MKKSKFFVSFIFIFLLFSFFTNKASAALITVTPQGDITQQVLGDSTIEVKEVAEGIKTTNGKIELASPATTSSKEDLVELVARENVKDVKIGSDGNNFKIEEEGIIAQTNFPITINAQKDELTVTTNSGDRIIKVLPYEAAQITQRGKFIDKINDNTINLNEDSKGELEYNISGQKNINLFNIAKITASVKSTVSASTGEILKVEEPDWLKFFGFLFT